MCWLLRSREPESLIVGEQVSVAGYLDRFVPTTFTTFEERRALKILEALITIAFKTAIVGIQTGNSLNTSGIGQSKLRDLICRPHTAIIANRVKSYFPGRRLRSDEARKAGKAGGGVGFTCR
jgi:hypothetical protein